MRSSYLTSHLTTYQVPGTRCSPRCTFSTQQACLHVEISYLAPYQLPGTWYEVVTKMYFSHARGDALLFFNLIGSCIPGGSLSCTLLLAHGDAFLLPFLEPYQVPRTRCTFPTHQACLHVENLHWRCVPLTLPENFTKKKMVFLFVSP